MTQENKELLLKDLCARLPYGVRVKYVNTLCKIKQIRFEEHSTSYLFNDDDFSLSINDIQVWKPYLRPMSSMTDEEIEIYRIIIKNLLENSVTDNIATLYNFLNSKHLDYNGLISLGLAIEVTEENNPYEA